jgi:hypothetical protein
MNLSLRYIHESAADRKFADRGQNCSIQRCALCHQFHDMRGLKPRLELVIHAFVPPQMICVVLQRRQVWHTEFRILHSYHGPKHLGQTTNLQLHNIKALNL